MPAANGTRGAYKFALLIQCRAAQYLVALDGVALHDLPLRVGQASGLVDDGIGYLYLAYVMHRRKSRYHRYILLR